MCNLYSITTNQEAIRALFRVINRYVGNLAPMPGVFPDYPAPVVRNTDAEREMLLMRWGMPPPPRTGGPPVTNIRNTSSPHWRGWLKRTFVSALVALIAQISNVQADSHSGGPAKVGVGQKEVTKNLLWLGPARQRDRNFVLKRYHIIASPPGVLSYTFVVTHLDGSTESFPAEEGEHKDVNRPFSGSLDIKLTRKTDDASYPVNLHISLGTRSEGDE
jgi:hypothetical protein